MENIENIESPAVLDIAPVVDKLGRILLETSLPVNDLEVQMQGLENGTYLIEVVEDKTNKRRVFNVIKSTDR